MNSSDAIDPLNKALLQYISAVAAYERAYQQPNTDLRLLKQIKAEIAGADQQVNAHHRWNIARDGNALLVCFNDHDKSQGCNYQRFIPEPSVDTGNDLEHNEQYVMQMAAISTAAIGYWREQDGINPLYDTVALRDVAKLYEKYDDLYRKVQAITALLQDGDNQQTPSDSYHHLY